VTWASESLEGIVTRIVTVQGISDDLEKLETGKIIAFSRFPSAQDSQLPFAGKG
jgi:hypothetical protein